MANYQELQAPPGTLARATSPPFIDVPNIHNFRGLSGLVARDGTRRVRPAYVFRSAEPSPATAEGEARVRSLGITRVYDFRSASEIERFQADTPIRELAGTARVFAPVLADATPEQHERRMGYYGEVGAQGFVAAYAEILHLGTKAYRTVFEHIRDRPQEALLVHCAAGKDRTGVFVALVADLVGVSRDDIAQEYSLTERGLAPWAPRIIEAMLKDPALKGDRARIERGLSAKKENMLAFLDKMYEDWGNAEGYLRKGMGFSDADIETIRANVSEPV